MLTSTTDWHPSLVSLVETGRTRTATRTGIIFLRFPITYNLKKSSFEFSQIFCLNFGGFSLRGRQIFSVFPFSQGSQFFSRSNFEFFDSSKEKKIGNPEKMAKNQKSECIFFEETNFDLRRHFNFKPL